MGLEVGRGLDHVGRADHPADPPAGHGIGLGHPVQHDAAVGDLRGDHGHGHEPGVAVDEVLIDLVGDHPQALLGGPAADLGYQLGRVDGPGGVGRRDEQNDLGPLGAGRLELLDADQVAGALVGHHGHRDAARQRDGLRVGGPVRRGHEDLVAGVEQGGEGLVDGLLAAVGDQHLGRLDAEAAVPRGLGRHGLAQLGQAGGRGVFLVPGHGAGASRGLNDVIGRREVGLARSEADDGQARGLERLGLGVRQAWLTR